MGFLFSIFLLGADGCPCNLRRNKMHDNDIFIPQKKVVDMTSLSATTIWREIKAKRFPQNYKIGPNRVAWRKSEILNWISERMEVA